MAGLEDEIPLQESETDGGLRRICSMSHLDSSGVDRSLIRSNLRRTPTECLQALEEMLELAESARRVDQSVR